MPDVDHPADHSRSPRSEGTGATSDAQEEVVAARRARRHEVSASPFGAADEAGVLNLMTAESRRAIWDRADPGTYFDLSVDYHVGMPSWGGLGDPTYQIWMSHTPAGTVADDPLSLGDAQNRLVAYSGDCISMYTHTGTHLDTLNHFGYRGTVWNGFTEQEHLGSRHWRRNGADRQPPVVTRGVLLDVAGAAGVDMLPDSHAIDVDELRAVMDRQGTEVRVGDAVLIRTGRMNAWGDGPRYLYDEPGLNRASAAFLAEAGAIIIGADNIALEQMPSADPDNWHPVHTYLLAEAGVPIMENIWLEEIAAEGLHEFALIGAGLKLRGATASPMRPLAFPLRPT